MKRIGVLIADNSALIREMFNDFLRAEPDIEVLGVACDALEAREKIRQLNPDVLTLDIEMPKMNGLLFLEKIMALRPIPVIMTSSLTQKAADNTIKALEIGAIDTITKPAYQQTLEAMLLLKSELIAKVRAAAHARIVSRAKHPKPTGIIPFYPAMGSRHLIAIGASICGVEAITEIFQRLPGNAPPIVIAQHMPERFTASFAARLNSISEMRVAEAGDGDRLAPGHAYLAPGGRHLKIMRHAGELVCRLQEGPVVSSQKPSVDVLFHSVAEAVGPRAVGVILTGIGKDGAVGLKAMRDHGAYTLGQNEATCVIYGMPQAAVKLGAVTWEAPLGEIPKKMLHHCEKVGGYV